MKFLTIQPKTMNEMIYFTTTRIETDISVGTWFFVSIYTQNNQRIFLVTNRHILQDWDRTAKRSKIWLKLWNSIEWCQVDWNVIEHTIEINQWIRDVKYDIITCNISSLINDFQHKNAQWEVIKECFFRAIEFNESIFPQNEWKNWLDFNEKITFVWYPNWISDDKHPTFPVFRNWHIATPIWIDYEWNPEFLIDAIAVPWSSWSPVFIINHQSYTSYENWWFTNNIWSWRIIFLWILSYCLTKDGKGNCVKNKISSKTLNYNSGGDWLDQEVSLHLWWVIKRNIVSHFLNGINNTLNIQNK